MLELNDPRWLQFQANYTDGGHVAKLLEQAESGEPLDRWYDDLFQELCHQYTVSEAAYPAAPHLVRLATTKVEFRLDLLVLLGGCYAFSEPLKDLSPPSRDRGRIARLCQVGNPADRRASYPATTNRRGYPLPSLLSRRCAWLSCAGISDRRAGCATRIKPGARQTLSYTSKAEIRTIDQPAAALNCFGVNIFGSNNMTIQDPRQIVAVFGLIRNPLGEVLMIESPHRGWELPGGQVEAREDLIQALEREILEETGVNAEINQLLGIYSRLSLPFMILLGFSGEYRSGELVTSEESLAVEWVKPEHVLARITHPAIRDRVQDLLAGNEKVIYRSYSTDPYRIHDQYQL